LRSYVKPGPAPTKDQSSTQNPVLFCSVEAEPQRLTGHSEVPRRNG
jgi:hypothetical protein